MQRVKSLPIVQNKEILLCQARMLPQFLEDELWGSILKRVIPDKTLL